MNYSRFSTSSNLDGSRSFYIQPNEGILSDIEYLNFPLDTEYKKYQLQPRSKQINPFSEKQSVKRVNPVQFVFLTFIEYLRDEKNLENLRQALCQRKDFNIPKLFNYIDSNQSGNLTCAEFTYGLKNVGLEFTIDSMKLIYSRFSKTDSREVMQLQHFSRIFMPLGMKYIPNNESKQFDNATVKLIGDLLSKYRVLETQFEKFRKKIIEMNIDVLQIYKQLDQTNSNRVSLDEFKNALNQFSTSPITNLDSLLLFARFDKSGDGTVTLLEFKEELKPKT
ncbi:hypothetical protein pb186bvf_013356 [Paramecium bursaria]